MRGRSLRSWLGLWSWLALAVACSSGPTEEVSPASAEKANPGFSFLPPLAVQSTRGTFEPRLAPEVRLDEIDANGNSVRTIAIFSAGKVGDEQVRRNASQSFYVARWRTSRYVVDPQRNYRARVFVGGRLLGYADIDVALDTNELRKVDRKRFAPLLLGDTLPIRFRIDTTAVDSDGDGVFDWLDDCPSVNNPAQQTSIDVPALGGNLPKGCDTARDACDPNESSCSPASFQQADVDRDGIGDACDCAAGFEGGALTSCADIDECTKLPRACDPRTTCTNTQGSYACSACPAGLSGDGVSGCRAVDDCAASCSPLVSCAKTNSGYQCGACPRGYAGDGHSCVDLDECATDNGGCGPIVVCTNTPGSFACGACPPGYRSDGYSCTDIDECLRPDACDALTKCTNTAGSYVCSDCPRGYTGSGKSSCVNIDECALGIATCSPAVSCADTAGSYTCGACPSGYRGDGKTCTEIDECSSTPGVCDALSTCTNTVGGYRCGSCAAGYDGDGEFCRDVDECQRADACDPQTKCTNTPGGYECSPCPPGNTGDGKTGCFDVDECAQGTDDCSDAPRVTCINLKTPGEPFRCSVCPPGFAGDGKTCVDVDECQINHGGCDPLVECVNSVGSFRCDACPRGYIGDGIKCMDVDECANAKACDPLTTCTNAPGGYQCSPCPAGYRGDGRLGCVDIDECARATGPCSPVASCTNTPGSYTCGACPEDYAGDGKACTSTNLCFTDDVGCPAHPSLVALASSNVCAYSDKSGGIRCSGEVYAPTWKVNSATPIAVADVIHTDSSKLYTDDAKRVIALKSAHDGCTAQFGDGAVQAWGKGYHGSLGGGLPFKSNEDEMDNPPSWILGPVVSLNAPVSIGVGYMRMCAALRDKRLACWGYNAPESELGPDVPVESNTPVIVPSFSNVISVVSGGAYHMCAVSSDRTISCWGDNSYGQLGRGVITNERLAPAVVPGVAGVVQASAGNRYTCAVLGDRSIKCWGQNGEGQLADGMRYTRTPTPVVAAFTHARRVATGFQHTCVLDDTGHVWCVGLNAHGQLGNGTNQSSLSLVRVAGISHAISVVVARETSCAVLKDGVVMCWGNGNEGELGLGDSLDRTTPVPFPL